MQKTGSDNSCILKFKPDFSHCLYKTSVDIVGNHISGILLFKKMTDSSIRVVFSNESGLTFFDFGFLPDEQFVVYQITPKMNKKAVIGTLRKDLDLILFRSMNGNQTYILSDSPLVYHAFPQSKGINYYITNLNCSRLLKMQRASDKKPVMEAYLNTEAGFSSPDSISLRHLNFDFTITMKKISALASQ